ncbi:MAG: hypothetical protein ACRELA_12385 [Candidatus Rokuibacteriota bacterium]
MNEQNLFDELRRAAETLGVAVRVEPFETAATAGGGRCVFQGKHLILIDAHAPLPNRIVILAQALSDLEYDTIFMVPEAREVVEAMTRGRSGATRITHGRPG